MKKILLIIVIVLNYNFWASAQAPELINYQAIARNTSGAILASTTISVRYTIHDGGTGGTIQYQETQSATTNTFGLFTLHVGGGTIVTGSMTGVTWGSGNKYLQVEIDPAGGSSYVDMGAQQLVSVPYALFAANGGGTSYTAGTGINITGTTINAQDTIALWNANKLQGIGISTTTPSPEQVLTFHSGSWMPITPSSTSGGTVTSVTAGTGLSGGTFTTSGTISLPNVGTAGTYGDATHFPTIITDAQGRISGVTTYSISAGGSGWGLTGNAGTTAGTNFIGTSDNHALRFKVNSFWAGDLNPSSGNVSFGINAGQAVTGGYSNVAIGNNALYSNTTSSNLVAFGDSALYSQNGGSGFNTAIGSKALYSNTTGYRNTAIGYNSLYYNTISYDNTAIGAWSLYSNTSGTRNTAIGKQALYSDTSGGSNTAIGYTSSYFNTTGAGNTAIGYTSLYSNTTGSNNTAIGGNALYNNLTGQNNTATGTSALNSNTASYNSAFGSMALYSNVGGTGNTAMGSSSLQSNIIGIQNTAIGNQALYYSIDSFCTAIGNQALYSNTTGYWNTAIGNQALYSNTTGRRNVCIGTSGGNTTGSYNTHIGWGTLANNSTGNYNTALGYLADMYGCCHDLTNVTVLGYNSGVTTSNTICIGNSSITSISTQVDLTITSDKRVKNNVQSNVPGLTFINGLNPVTYHYDIKKENELLGVNDSANWQGKYDIEKITFSGFLAQDVDATAKQIGYDFNGVDKSRNVWGIRYSDFIPSIVKAEQELNTQNLNLKNTVESQNQKIELMQKQIDELMKLVLEKNK